MELSPSATALAVSECQDADPTIDRSVTTPSPVGSTLPTLPLLNFTRRGTVGVWYNEECDFANGGDPGPSSTTYGPDLWKARRCAWLAGDLELNPPAPKVHSSSVALRNSDDSKIDAPPADTLPSPTSPLLHDDAAAKPVLSAIQTLSAKARGKLPSFLHIPYAPPTQTAKPPSPSSASMLSSLEKLEILMAEPGAEENDKVWRQGGLEAIWRMLTDSKTLKQPMRLGLVIQILKAGWIRDGTWPSSLSKDGKSRRAVEAVVDDPFFASPPPSPILAASAIRGEQRIRGEEREPYCPPKRL
ncbi:hypothetical protein NliqN6_1625 [Naganishia liquefaciens]|uniref:Uncharacterized protein n=1 Tax=Naganishia liquefaciens TaxID=104408 RepID=A0A8H3TQ96_9TREE|nr:hypothetical protein NliqN6_1625 [Naganishia liquefaciens]